MRRSSPFGHPLVIRAAGVPVALLAVVSLAGTAAAAPTARAGGADPAAGPRVRTVATFDHAAAQTPENLLVRRGYILVSLAFASTVAVVAPSGTTTQSVTLDTRGGFIAGLTADPARHAVAVSVSSPDAAIAGIWVIPLRDRDRTHPLGTPYRLAALPGGAFPNGVTRAPDGDLFAADSLLSTIWRVPAGAAPGAPAQAWLVDDALAPDASGLPGANGLKVHGGRLYVTNTARATLLSVPIVGPRTPTLVRDDLRIDDIAFDADGTLYAALNQGNAVVRTRAAAGAPVEVLADGADGVHNPSAIAVTSDDGLYVTNAAFDGPVPPPSLQFVRFAGERRERS